MKKLINIFILCTAFYYIMGAQNSAYNLDSLFTNQEYGRAIEKLKSIEKADTANFTIKTQLADAYLMVGDMTHAKIYYHQMESAQEPHVLSQLAYIYEIEQNAPKALKYNLALSELYPQNTQYLRKIAALYYENNETTQAIQYYQKAIYTHNRDILSIYGLSEIYYIIDSVALASKLLQTGFDIDSTHIGLHFLKSKIHYREKNYKETVNTLERIVGRVDLPIYYNNLLGYSYVQVDSVDKAIFHLTKTLNAHPMSETPNYFLGWAYEKKKDLERAQYYYNTAIQSGISQKMPLYHQALARTYSAEKKYSKAIEEYQHSLEYEDNPILYMHMGIIAENAYKDKKIALKYYNQYFKKQTQPSEYDEYVKERIKVLNEYQFMKK